ncbi:hypothetical protein F5Y18DRAFT_271099 [Xylariaceae sp. FL1019]|nr:hypothetical protein F5Y18DRAFT_271099 [Xylariaceae sp. FL1019]
MAYQKRILATSTVFEAESNGVWSFADINGDGSQDLVYIKTRQTASGKVEVHASPYESRYQKRGWTLRSGFVAEDNGTWLMQDWNGDQRADLVYVKTRNTTSGKVEVHIADAKSQYQRMNHYVSGFGIEENGTWTMSRSGDLVYIKTRNTDSGKVECVIASRKSKYQQIQSVATSFDVEDNGTWCLAPKSIGDLPDLYYIKTRETTSEKVEVYAASATSGWKGRSIATASFEPETSGQWAMVDFSHQDQPDLAYIKNISTSRGKIEVHINEPRLVVPSSYVKSCKNVKLDSCVLHAILQRNDGSWRNASVDLGLVLGNVDGKFCWGGKGFHGSARDIKFDGCAISAELRKVDESWISDSFNLQEKLMNNDGVFQATEVPAVLAVPLGQERIVYNALQDLLTREDVEIYAVKEPEGASAFYANAGVKSEKDVIPLFRTLTAEATASVMHIAKSDGHPITQVSADVLTAGVNGSLGLFYAGFEANACLFKAEASIFDLTLGLGVDSGAGIKDDSYSIEALGCGISIGRKVSISYYGSSFGIDFGRLFGW